MHEFIHVLMGEENILDIDEENLSYIDVEKKVNLITSKILMPDEILFDHKFTNIHSEIIEIAKKLKVSSFSLAIKLKQMGLITQSIVEEVKKTSIENFEENLKKEKKSNPDFYTVLNSKLSPSFSEAVISQTRAGEITFTEAFNLLGVKGNTFDKFANTFFNYG
jgi:Zn-dependent peptidase ImmA (M78 family)